MLIPRLSHSPRETLPRDDDRVSSFFSGYLSPPSGIICKDLISLRVPFATAVWLRCLLFYMCACVTLKYKYIYRLHTHISVLLYRLRCPDKIIKLQDFSSKFCKRRRKYSRTTYRTISYTLHPRRISIVWKIRGKLCVCVGGNISED